MRRHISLARDETRPVLEEASALLKQKCEAETKQRLFDAFTTHFVVPDEDLLALTSSEEPIDDHFFTVLARVKQVHHDCEILLGGDHEKLGLEIMEQSSRHINIAYQKLYRWIQKELKSLNVEDPRIGSSIRRSLRVLAERPSLFHSCLDFFAEARDYTLSDAFHYALTNAVGNAGAEDGGVAGRNVKPIEFSAHDPLRYIGDMLAWVHSAAVSEQEALEALFVADEVELARGIQAGLYSEPWNRPNVESDDEKRPDDERISPVTFDGQKALRDLVNRDLAGVGRSLRQRVELVIQGQDDPVTCYKAANLFAFYGTTFAKLLGPESQMVDLMRSLEKYIFAHMELLIREQISALSADATVVLGPPDDLSPPDYLLDALDILTSLMKAYEASFGGETAPDTTTTTTANRFTPVLRAAFDPFMDLARSAAQELSDDPTAQVIYRTNLVLTARATIAPFPFASCTHMSSLSNELSSLRMDLLDIQRRYLLENSGLQGLLVALEPFSSSSSKRRRHDGNGPEEEQEDKHETDQDQQSHDLARIFSLPAFQPDPLIATGQQLDDFLPSALMDAADHLKRVQSAAFVKSVTEEAVEAFCRDFEFVEGMIIGADEAAGRSGGGAGAAAGDEEDEDEQKEGWSLRALFPRTTGEIRVLLS